jgi:hypothetical protein
MDHSTKRSASKHVGRSKNLLLSDELILTDTTAETPAERRTWSPPSVAWVLLATLGLQVGLNLLQAFSVGSKGGSDADRRC